MSKLVAALALAPALVSAPFVAVYCDDASSRAMACCRDKASECNTPGATDDCCKKMPTEKGTMNGTAQVRAEKRESTPTPMHGAVALAATRSGKSAQLSTRTRGTAALDTSPALPSVLRV
jgi:hypothetical protein